MWHHKTVTLTLTIWKRQISNNYDLKALEYCAGKCCTFITIYSLYNGMTNFTKYNPVYFWQSQFLVTDINLNKNKYVLLLNPSATQDI